MARSHESPMDFQFDNLTGPLDGRSPFAQLNGNAQRIPNNVNMTPRKRPQSGFDSPSKSRTMGNQQSSPTKPLPAIPPGVPAFNGLFSTPRKPKDDFDDSSAGETPRSPEPRDDSDATPEIKSSRRGFTAFDSASASTLPGAERERSSPSKQRPGTLRRESAIMALTTKIKNKFNSPGRGEMHAGAIEKASRRRKKEADRRVRKRRHSMSDSGEDNESTKSSAKKESENKPHWAGTLFTFLAEHPSLPQTLSYYAQFVFNVFLLCCCGYLIYAFWSTVMSDVDKKAHEAMADIMADIANCNKEYSRNNCEPDKRTPFIEPYCNEWDRCRKRDPYTVARAKVSAHTFAEIFNSFVEPISYKAMIFTAVLVFGCFGISNFAFGYFRRQPSPNYAYGYGYGPPPPPTPQRSSSNPDGGFYAGTPWHQPPLGMGFEPQPSGGFGQIGGQGSPQRRLMYN